MDVIDGETRTFAGACVEGLSESAEIVGRHRHPEDRGYSRNTPERVERLDLTPETSLDSTDLVVGLLVAVQADRDDGVRRAPARDPLDARHDAIGEKPVGRKMQKRKPPPAGDDSLENVVDVRSEENLPSGEVRPRDVRILADDRHHFIGCQFVFGLALPDVARLALVLTPVRQAEVQLERCGGTAGCGLKEGDAEMGRAFELVCEASARRHAILLPASPGVPTLP